MAKQDELLLSLSIAGIFLSVVLLYFNATKYTTSIYLGIFFLFISLYGIIQYVVLFSKSIVLVGIVFTNVGFPTYLIGPLLYFYFRSVLSDNARLKKHDLWHLLPMLVFFAGAFPYIISPWSFKLEVAQKIIGKDTMLTPLNSDLVSMYKYISLPIVFMSRPVLAMGYLLWSAGLLFRFKMYHKESRVLHQQRFMQKWLSILLFFLFILVLSHALQLVDTFTVMSTAIFKTLNLLQVFAAIGLAGLLISPFFFPEILYGLPRLPKSLETLEIAVVTNEPLPAEPVSVSSKFETDYLHLIGKQTDHCMSEYRPYLQQDFNLAQLAVLISVLVHHLAYYFREVKQMSFTDFRNRWRIEHAKSLILEGKSNDLTLEAIGFLSGFASRNTFLNAFKKVEGITIPLSLKVGKDGEYTLSVIENSFWETVDISLKDLEKQSIYDLRTNLQLSFNLLTTHPDRFLLLINGATGLEENPQEDDGIEIYSYGNQVFIRTDEPVEYQVGVYNLLGQQMLHRNLSSLQDLSGFSIQPTGFYLIIVNTDKTLVTKKVFIR